MKRDIDAAVEEKLLGALLGEGVAPDTKETFRTLLRCVLLAGLPACCCRGCGCWRAGGLLRCPPPC